MQQHLHKAGRVGLVPACVVPAYLPVHQSLPLQRWVERGNRLGLTVCHLFSGDKIQRLEKSGPVACEHWGEEFSKADSRDELITSFCSIFKAVFAMPFSGHSPLGRIHRVLVLKDKRHSEFRERLCVLQNLSGNTPGPPRV